jgi:hypothetical protein
MQSPDALPVLAITSFLRWWGSLFYLQVKGMSHAIFFCADSIVVAMFHTASAGF